MVKVSIVIPVYNRKNFLTVCIKSLLAQSFEDFEICLVDDGSTDGTGLLWKRRVSLTPSGTRD